MMKLIIVKILDLYIFLQGLDMSAMAALAAGPSQNDDVVCTPDFPLEPLCEVRLL